MSHGWCKPAALTPWPEDSQVPPTFLGRCIGRTQIGRKCLFIDVIIVPDDAADDRGKRINDIAPITDGSGMEQIVHRVGSHVTRKDPLRVNFDELIGAAVVSCRVCISPEQSLDVSSAQRLAAALGDPTGFTKPRVGDVFRMTVRDLTGGDEIVNGARLFRAAATGVDLLVRGPVSRPGDFATRWNVPTDAALRRPFRVGNPRRTRGRFRQFAEFCVDRFLRPVDGSPTKRPIVLDVAGGCGKLSTEIVARCAAIAVVVDPRGSAIPADKGDNEEDEQDDDHDETIAEVPAAVDDRDAAAVEEELQRVEAAVERSDPSQRVEFLKAFFEPCFLGRLIGRADFIVGLHCDGAVNAIVDAACEHHTSFAIVACCVFPRTYIRHLEDGRVVVSRDDLNAWIVEQCRLRGYPGTVWCEQLPFPGANVAVCGMVPTLAEG